MGGLQIILEDGLDTLEVLGERSAANFYFSRRILAEIKITGICIAKPVHLCPDSNSRQPASNKDLAFP